MSNIHSIQIPPSKLRAGCESEIISLGLSKSDLIDPCSAIAVLTARAWGRANPDLVKELFNNRPSTVDEFILEGMRYESDAPSEILACAIENLPALVPYHGHKTLSQIGALLEVFSRYSGSTPDGWESDAWRKVIADAGIQISAEARCIQFNPKHDRTRIDAALKCVIENFGNLWD